MIDYTIENILPYLGEHEVVGDSKNIFFNSIKPAFESDANSLAWISHIRIDKQEIFDNCCAKLIIIDESIVVSEAVRNEKCLIILSNPRLVFTKILNGLFINGKSNIEEGTVHPSSIISPEAIIHKSVTIGPFNVIGKCTIGEGTYIGANNTIHDNVIIGNRVRINEYNLLGGAGFGFVKDEDNTLIKIPHIGGLVIENDVEIFTHVNIDRGTLGQTMIKNGAKIDHHVHISHNCNVGENSLIVAHSVMCGGSVVGNNVFVGAGSHIRDAINISDESFIGMGTVITKHVPEGETWIGNPGQRIDK
jgi:UDP-3-O-[3-hydroxymyristoyl] glucosamine N-acyltransferase